MQQANDSADPDRIPLGKPSAGTRMFPSSVQTASKPVGSSIPVTENCVMSISASGGVTQKGITQLIAYPNLIKSSFPN